MLVDASPATWPTTACSVAAWKPLCDVMHDPTLDPERLDVFPAFEAVAAIGSLGDLPMTVMTAAHRVAPALTQASSHGSTPHGPRASRGGLPCLPLLRSSQCRTLATSSSSTSRPSSSRKLRAFWR